MSLRVNNNITAITAHRNLQQVSADTSKNLQRLASGLKVNQAADGPATLVVSEQIRAQIAGVDQAIENTESSISMVQVAEASLGEVNKLLTGMRQLAVHASNAGVNDSAMLDADQAEFENALKSIDRIAGNTQFGTKKLLDGSTGASGVANGDNLQFVSASVATKGSPVGGYRVDIQQAATKANLKGSVALTQEMVNAGETLTITEGGRSVQFKTTEGDTVESTFNKLQQRIDEAGMNVEVESEGGVFKLEHREYGSAHSFTASSSTAGILSPQANVFVEANQGSDVRGSINGEEAIGQGQLLTGRKENQNTAELAVRYTGEAATPTFAGTITVTQNSLNYQIGGNQGQTAAVSLRNMSSNALGTGVANESDFGSLRDVDLRNLQGAQDALLIIDQAISQTSTTRADLGAFQKNTLETNLNSLRVSSENLTASESVIRDADMAKEMASFTRNQILTQSATAMLAQANSQQRNVLSLLQG
jgi:flagellin